MIVLTPLAILFFLLVLVLGVVWFLIDMVVSLSLPILTSVSALLLLVLYAAGRGIAVSQGVGGPSLPWDHFEWRTHVFGE